MSDVIKVEANALEDCVHALQSISAELSEEKNVLNPVRIELGSIPNILCSFAISPVSTIYSLISLIRPAERAGTIYGAVSASRSQLSAISDVVNELAEKIKQVSLLFDDAENQLMFAGRSIVGEDPFDNIGQNGGDQGHAAGNYDQYSDFRRIIEQNSGLTFDDDNDLKAWLDHMNSTGCSYVALCNALMEAFRGREEEFEKIFGYPMFDENGEFNFDCLTVDIYSYAGYNEGMFVSQQADTIRRFCSDHGIDADVTVYSNQTLTAADYRRMVSDGEAGTGELMISVGCPFSLMTMDGEPFHTWKDGAHAMTVIGTQGDYLIVSSWGKTFLLDPSSNNSFSTGDNTNDYGYLTVRVNR